MIVRLEPQHWQAALAILARAPYAEVAPLINAIGQQIERQQAEQAARPNVRDINANPG